MKITCFHHHDADGLGAAYAVHRAFPNAEVKYFPIDYGDNLHLTVTDPDDQFYFVDFCPKPGFLAQFCGLGGRVTVIDHHKTSIADMFSFFTPAGSDAPKWPASLSVIFDTKMSGCELAWKHLHPDVPCPTALQYIGDYDLWNFKLENSKAVNAWIAAQPSTVEAMIQIVDRLQHCPMDEIVSMGDAILMADQRHMEKLLKRARPITLDGLSGLVVNTAHLGSEMGNYILTRPELAQIDFAALYFELGGKTMVSLRSRKGGQIDVSAMAKKRGGGGHFNAARYEMPFSLNFC